MRCKRCHGNLFTDYDNELTCLQCGATYIRSDISPVRSPEKQKQDKMAPAPRQSKYAWSILDRSSLNGTWFAPHQIRFNMEDILFLLIHLNLLQKGVYPPDHRDTGYTMALGIQKTHSRHAPFETPVQIAGELDQRLARTGLDRYLVEEYFCGNETIESLAWKLNMDESKVQKHIRAAVSYIASGPCPRWLNCVDCNKYQECWLKKHIGITYQEWKGHRRRDYMNSTTVSASNIS